MITRDQRIMILERDNYRCCLCGRTRKRQCELHVHHIKPKYKDGSDDFFNVIVVCKKCHQKDHNKLHYNDDIVSKFKKHVNAFKKPKRWDEFKLGDELTAIRITEDSKNRIKRLSKKKGYKEITILEYLLKGKISLEEFKNI